VSPNPDPALEDCPESKVWARVVDRPGGERQHPVDELIGEHGLQRLVLHAMHFEALRLAKWAFRDQVWGAIADFLGNYGLLFHYRKKAMFLYPALATHGLSEAIDGMEKARQQDIELTLDLCGAVQSEDWEPLLRLSAIVVSEKRRLMEQEEQLILRPARGLLSPVEVARLRNQFDELEQKALLDRTRGDFLGVLRGLLTAVGQPDPTR
jgi:hypothetical protein